MRLNSNPRRLPMGVKISKQKSEWQPEDCLVGLSYYAICTHTLMRVCSDKKSAHWHNIHVQRSYMYGARQAIISTVRMGRAYSGHMLLWFFQYYQNQRHQRSSGSHIPRSQAVKITFGKFTCSINADALQYIAQQSLSIRYTSFSIIGDHLTFVGIWFSIYNKITPFMLTWG